LTPRMKSVAVAIPLRIIGCNGRHQPLFEVFESKPAERSEFDLMPKAKLTKPPCDAARKAAMPASIKPMLATLVDEAFSDPDWLFETKWDGVRAICFIRNGKARFISRNPIEMTAQYPELANIANSINGSNVVLDGEIVALDEKGVSRFQL